MLLKKERVPWPLKKIKIYEISQFRKNNADKISLNKYIFNLNKIEKLFIYCWSLNITFEFPPGFCVTRIEDCFPASGN